MKTKTIAIIGCGPRGLYSLYALTRQLKLQQLKLPLNIHVIEPNEFGAGSIYRSSQPDYQQFNTIVSKSTSYFANEGPTLYQWMKKKGLEVEPTDYVARNMQGKYLIECFNDIERKLPENVNLIKHQTTAYDIRKLDNRYIVYLEDQSKPLFVDQALLTTGHTLKKTYYQNRFCTNHQLDVNNIFYSTPYPTESSIGKLSKDKILCIAGMGHVAIDAVFAATEGRGGVFVRNKDGILKYIASGNETKLVMISRSGIPFYSKPKPNTNSIPHKPHFLTIEKIDILRKYNLITYGSSKLDFQKQLLPLIIREMEYLYYKTLLGDVFGTSYLNAKNSNDIEDLISKINPNDKFDWQKITNPLLNKKFYSVAEFQSFMLDFLKKDLFESSKGAASAVKTATNFLHLTLRDNISYAVEFGGLTPSSEKYYHNIFIPIRNRVAVGIHYDRFEQILALIESNILDISIGPDPQIVFDTQNKFFNIKSNLFNHTIKVDIFLECHLNHSDINNDLSELIKNLLKKGLIREFCNKDKDSIYHSGAVDVNRAFQVIGADNKEVEGLYAMGVLTEGKFSVTYLSAMPGTQKGALYDADLWAKHSLNHLLHLSEKKVLTARL